MTKKQHLSLLLDASKAQLNKRNLTPRNTRNWHMADVAARALFNQAMAIAKELKLQVTA